MTDGSAPPMPLDETWARELTVSGVTPDTSSRAVLLAIAREARSHRERIQRLELTVDAMGRRLKTAGSVLATVVALAAALGQHIPVWLSALLSQ